MKNRFCSSLFLLLCVACGGGGGSTASTTAPAEDVSPSVVTPAPPPEAPPAPPAPPVADLDTPLRTALAGAGVVTLTLPAQNPAQVALGQALMFDKILSGNRDIACATCHHPTQSTGDGLSLSIGTGGVGLGPGRSLGTGKPFIARNANPLFNLSQVDAMFWDGRATTATPGIPAGLTSALAVQAMFPVTDRDEMRGQVGENELAAPADDDLTGIWSLLMVRLTANPTYVSMFNAAFPDVPTDQLGFQHAANAIAAFEASEMIRLNSPFDRYLAGDNAALTDAQKRGALLFFGQARCAVCHRGPLLSDFQFHSIGAPQVGPGKPPEAPLDFGRERVTGARQDRFQFRTAPLRNVAVTGPWTHSGAYTTLEAVVRHYINPAQAVQNYDPSQLDPRLQSQVHVQESIAAGLLQSIDPVLRQPNPLNPQEVGDLVEFLRSLTDPNPAPAAPPSVPSGLPVD